MLTSYIVAAAIATPLTGWLSDRLSVKRLLIVSIAGFTVASALCGLSETLVQIVGARLLQGVFGAALVPLSQSILLDINPREKQGQAMAIWGMGVMVGPILGPTLGGWLTDSYNWRWVFFINVPIGAFALAGVMTFLPARAPRPHVKFDAFGFATLALAIGAFQAMLDRGEQLDWFGSYEIRIEAIVAALSFAFFLVHTATVGKASFFKSELLRDPNFATGTLFIFVVGAVLYATRAAAADAAEPDGLPGRDDGPRHRAKRRRHDDRDAVRRQAAEIRGCADAAARGLSISALALWQMMQYTVVLSEADIVWPGVVQGFGLGRVRAAERAVVLDAAARPACGRHGHLQPDAQHRQQYRHLDRADADDAQHAGRACRPRDPHHAVQPGRAGDGRQPRRHRAARPHDQPAGVDDRVPERLR